MLRHSVAVAVVAVFMIIGPDPLGQAASHYRRGMAAMAGKNYSTAVVEFSIAIRQHPKFAQGYYQLGRALLAKRKIQDAFSAFSAAVTLDADFVDAQVALRELYLAAAKTGGYGLIALRYDPNSRGASELLPVANAKAEPDSPQISSLEPSSHTTGTRSAEPGGGTGAGSAAAGGGSTASGAGSAATGTRSAGAGIRSAPTSDAFQPSTGSNAALAQIGGQLAPTEEGSAKTSSGSSMGATGAATTGTASAPNSVTSAPTPNPVQVQGALGNILTKIDPRHFTGGAGASYFRRIYLENDHTDWGPRINSADAQLGANPGIIEIAGGGTFSTTAVISANHVLLIDAGTYTNTSPGPMLTPKSNSAIIGSGWNTVLMESTAAGSWTVIIPFNSHRDNYLGDRNIHIASLQIRGANPRFNSAPQAIGLGNLVYGSVQNVWINATKSIGIQAGGGSAYGNFADTVRISNCLFTHVASQNLAVVNGTNIMLQNNVFRDPGQPGGPGSSPIDLEPNMGTDILDNIRIIGNVVDHRGSPICCGNGIIVYGSPNPLLSRPVLVRNNILIGGEIDPVPSNHMANGIYLINARNAEVANNTIRRTGQSGIYLATSTHVQVNNNNLFQVGGGGLYGFVVDSTTNSRIAGNVIEAQASGGGSADDHILELRSSDYNEYVNNVSGGIISVGPHNRLSGNRQYTYGPTGSPIIGAAPAPPRTRRSTTRASGAKTAPGGPSGGSAGASAVGGIIGVSAASHLPPASGPSPFQSPASLPPVARLILKSLDSKNMLLTPLEMATVYDYVVLHAESADAARQLKSLNPNVTVLLYQAPHYSGTSQENWSALNDHEPWFMHDLSGRRTQSDSKQYLMDIRNPEFRAYQIESIMNRVNTYGFDGLLWDGPPGAIAGNLRLNPGPDPAAVSTWHQDVLTFLKEMKQALGSKWLVTNSTASYDTGIADMDDTDYLPYVSGTEIEGFGHAPWSPATEPPNDWMWQQRMAQRNLSAGKFLYAAAGLQLPAAPDQIRQWQIFTFGSALLWADGVHVSYDWTPGGTLEAGITFPEMDIPLGSPLGAAYSIDGVTERDFTGGKVVINPSASAMTINLPIGLHTLDGSIYTQTSPTVKIAPWSALILFRD